MARILRVVKRKGRYQKFSRAKIERGIIRSGAERKLARTVTSEVAKKCFDGISTRRVGDMVVERLRKRDRTVAAAFNRHFRRRWS